MMSDKIRNFIMNGPVNFIEHQDHPVFYSNTVVHIDPYTGNARPADDARQADDAQWAEEVATAGEDQPHAPRKGRVRDSFFTDPEFGKKEAARFISYLKEKGWDDVLLDSRKDNAVTQAFLHFYRRWKKEGGVVESAPAAYRFLHDDCGIKCEVGERTYTNKLLGWIWES